MKCPERIVLFYEFGIQIKSRFREILVDVAVCHWLAVLGI